MTDARQLLTARLFVLTAALLWSTSGFFAKAPFFKGWPGPTIAFWRAVFALIILIPMIRRPVWNWRIVPMSLAFAVMNYTYLSALEKGTAANAIWLQCLAPTWVLIVGVKLLGEHAGPRDWRMAGFSLAGIGLILVCELRNAGTDGQAFEAVLWGVSSGVCYAAVVLFLRVMRGIDAGWLIAVNHAVTVVALTPCMLGDDARFPSGVQWPLLAAFGMLQMGVPYVLFTRSLRTHPRPRGEFHRLDRTDPGACVDVAGVERSSRVVVARRRRIDLRRVADALRRGAFAGCEERNLITSVGPFIPSHRNNRTKRRPSMSFLCHFATGARPRFAPTREST